ncbi:hypothetical protein M8J76_009180 [Diaphorina citri]|nr:hypothetical protein M8J76_009180 [Diaphorina citri]
MEGWDESKTSDKTPVLVYIHGESFSWNSGSVYDGTVLSSFASMVVVTVNYRLGILDTLGFLEMTTSAALPSPPPPPFLPPPSSRDQGPSLFLQIK